MSNECPFSREYDKQEGPKMVAFVHVSRGIMRVKLGASRDGWNLGQTGERQA